MAAAFTWTVSLCTAQQRPKRVVAGATNGLQAVSSARRVNLLGSATPYQCLQHCPTEFKTDWFNANSSSWAQRAAMAGH